MLEFEIAQELIKPHMRVVGSNDGDLAEVDCLEGGDLIKLGMDEHGEHHYIPISWVTSVDDKVHVDRPGSQVKREWSTSPTNIKA